MHPPIEAAVREKGPLKAPAAQPPPRAPQALCGVGWREALAPGQFPWQHTRRSWQQGVGAEFRGPKKGAL